MQAVCNAGRLFFLREKKFLNALTHHQAIVYDDGELQKPDQPIMGTD